MTMRLTLTTCLRLLFKTSLKSLFKPAAILSAILLALMYIGSPLLAAEAARDPAGFDILGMKLGMSVAEIQEAIKAHNPSVEIKITKLPITEVGVGNDQQRVGVGKFVQFLEQVDLRSPGFPEFIGVAFTATPPAKAFYIGRKTKFPVGQQPLMDKMVLQLREKYGPESGSFLRSTAFNWIFDKAGKPSVPRANFRFDAACAGGPGAASYGRGLFDSGALVTPQSYWPGCGIELVASLDTAANNNLVSELSERLVWDSIAIDDIQKLMAEAKAMQEQQRQQQEQKASGVKPQL